jgi:hypothetical protein
MRVRVRPGYAFHRIERYVNLDGSIRKEKLAEVILGPVEIGVTAEELRGQEHKVEVLSHESTEQALPVGAGGALDAEAEPNPSALEADALQTTPERNCDHCGMTFERLRE